MKQVSSRFDEKSLFFYNRKYKRSTERVHSFKTKLLEFLPKEKSRVLDIGCGSGVMAEKIRDLGHDVQGVDISKEGIERLKSRGIEGRVVNVDEELPFEDGTFDAIWCGELIEHIQSPEFILDEAHRVLKDDGVFLLSTCNSAYFIFRVLHLLGRTCSEIQHPYHFHFFTTRSLRELLENSRFKILEFVGRNTPVIFPKKALKPFFSIPLLTEARILKLLDSINFKVENTVTRGPLILFSFFSKRAISFFADALLVKAAKA